jgi:DNA-binding MarR family transcriptional regulator
VAGPLRFDPIGEAHRQWVSHLLGEPKAMAAATSIMRAQQLVNASIEHALEPFGLTFSRWELLMLLSFSSGRRLPITKAGERLMIHPTGVSKLVDKLEAQGFVARVPDLVDRRTTLATLLPAGADVAARAAAAVAQVRFGIDLEDADLQTLVEVLGRLRARAGDFVPESGWGGERPSPHPRGNHPAGVVAPGAAPAGGP